MTEPECLSRRVARFVAGSRAEHLPPDVQAYTTRLVLNGFGTALGGASDAALQGLGRALMPFSSAPQATVIGRETRADMPTAAFLNAAAINVFDFDDNHYGTVIHPTAPVLPAALALAETRDVSGAELLHAVALGLEATCRLGLAISPGHYDRGWHITATCGIFGAAVAASKLLGLDETRTLWALGNASAQSSGLVETLGHMAKSVGVGHAARGGLMAALMAAEGVAGPEAPLEGKRGFITVVSDDPHPERIVSGLGDDWELFRTFIKPYPCGIVLNPVIDACLAARREPGFSVDRIESISVRCNPLLKARADRPGVTTGREAQVSAQHAIAVSLIRGTAGVADFSDIAVNDPAVRRLATRVTEVNEDASIPAESVELTLYMSDETPMVINVASGRGNPGNPMTDDELEAKFLALSAHGAPDVSAETLLNALWRFPMVLGISQITTLSQVRPQADRAARKRKSEPRGF